MGDDVLLAKLISTQSAQRLRKAVGFRNLAVHEYARIDWDIVHAILLHHLDDFSTFAHEVSRHRNLLPQI